MEVEVLGATVVRDAGQALDLGAAKQRALLARLALRLGRPVSVAALVDAVWPEDPPPGAEGTLQTYVSALRRLLEPDRAPRAPATVLVTTPPGYALRLPPEAIDAQRLDAAVSAARSALAALLRDPIPGGGAVDPAIAVAHREAVGAALGSWHGEPYLDLADLPEAVSERRRLDELRLAGEELLATLDLASGASEAAVTRAARLREGYALRERLVTIEAVGLTRVGRQADALELLRVTRERLADELGIDPGPGLRAVEAAILQQQPAVMGGPAPVPPSPPPPVPAPRVPAMDDLAGALPQWPLVGRDKQLAALGAELAAAESGQPRFVALVGEPGIGKSRLTEELAAVAAARGVATVYGRCSQDDGAPPLLAWSQVMAGIGGPSPDGAVPAPRPVTDDAHGGFAVFDALTSAVATAAAERPLVVVLEDLHWADDATLRAVRHLVTAPLQCRLLVVATWRGFPAPTGALGDVGEAMARRHALRLDLDGLQTGEVAELVASVGGVPLPAVRAAALRSRTEGNPFFVVEYARLLATGGGSSTDALPTAVADVLTRRVARLPESTAQVLQAASILGREFELDVLVALLGREEDRVLDDLDTARAAGLIEDVSVDRSRFAHALARDSIYAGVPLTRRGRAHARAAALLEDRGSAGHEAELARHWLHAGEAHAAKAWRAAWTAAAVARESYAHEQAAALLLDALAAQRLDPSALAPERYAMLMQRAEACRWSADAVGMLDAVHEAIRLARQLGDVRLLARAAMTPSEESIWQPRIYGSTDWLVVEALRDALGMLADGDDPLRCRVMLALANELYYVPDTWREREALADEALAMARRLAVPSLVAYACRMANVAIERGGTLPLRARLADEGVDALGGGGDPRSRTMALLNRAVVAGELGRFDRLLADTDEVMAIARERRMWLPFTVAALARAPGLAMAGRADQAMAELGEVDAAIDQALMPQAKEGIAGAWLTTLMWTDQLPAIVPLAAGLTDASVLPLRIVPAALAARVDGAEAGRAALAGADVSGDLDLDDWIAPFLWGLACELAYRIGDAALAARAYARAASMAGTCCCAGTTAHLGPFDMFLAMAAEATGERDLAVRHAEAATALIAAWDLPLLGAWWGEQREAAGW